MFLGASAGWYTLPKEKVTKWDARGKCAIIVGYAENSKAYKLIDLRTALVVVSRDVVFNEELAAVFGLAFNETDVCTSDVTKEIVACSVKLDGDDGCNEVDRNESRTDEGSMRVGDVADVNTIEVNSNGQEVIQTPDGDDEEVRRQRKQATAVDHKEEIETQEYATEYEPSIASTGQSTRSGRICKPPDSWCRAYLVKEYHNALVATASREISQSFR